MSIDKFITFRSTCVPLSIENVDTDQIIPARYLKATTREGFGENLFRDWRYDKNNLPRKDFVLNNPRWSGSILVAGRNFGSGSSREHAAWALHDFGFRAVISSFFADIFKNNSLNNGLLPVQVSEAFYRAVITAVEADPRTELEINLSEQTVTLLTTCLEEHFEINAYKKECLMNGYDDIDYLLSIRDKIEEFEKSKE